MDTNRNSEFVEIFIAEALNDFDKLNQLFTDLEKDHTNSSAIQSIFRITHTLKANASALGFTEISELSHLLEDIFSLIKQGELTLDAETFTDLYRANDKLGELLSAVKTNKPVSYKGLKRRLEVILRNALGQDPVDEVKEKLQVAGFIAQNTTDEKHLTNEPQSTITAVTKEYINDEESENADSNITFSDLVQVPIRKLDTLVNLVGELLIERDRLIAVFAQNGRKNEFARLNRMTGELQYSVMDIRLVQVNILFNKFYRIVRDVAHLEGKKVNLIIEGGENEIDRNVLQTISDSLIHLVRNAVSHGIEAPESRVLNQKSAYGTIKLSARTERDGVVIEVEDDGKGIDPEKVKQSALKKGIISKAFADRLSADECIELIFEPNFSTAETITSISGRGVGMDVVKRSIDSIGGKVRTTSQVGKGTKFTLTLPSSLAVKGALLFELNQSDMAVPLTFTEAVTTLSKNLIHKVGKGLVSHFQNKNLPLIFLSDLFSIKNPDEPIKNKWLQKGLSQLDVNQKAQVIVVSHDGRQLGLVVDRLLQQREIVEKPLSELLEDIRFISGATILGNGKVCLILDVPDIANYAFRQIQLLT